MADMLPETKNPLPREEEAAALGELLHAHKGGDVTVLDLRVMDAWTDFFVIATATSNTHLDGLERHVKEFCRERDLEILRRSRKGAGEEDEWRLFDLGWAVIHLMSDRLRSFYELERLYPEAHALKQGEAAYSSKSSKSPSSS